MQVLRLEPTLAIACENAFTNQINFLLEKFTGNPKLFSVSIMQSCCVQLLNCIAIVKKK